MLSPTTAPTRKCAPSVGGTLPKNRAWDFFGDSVSRAWGIDPQVVGSHLEKTTTDRKTASGVPYWPSRDPIGERGGVNLYAFVGNDGVNDIDYLGEFNFIGAGIAIGFDLGIQMTVNYCNGESLLHNIDGKSLLVSGLIGGVFPGFGKLVEKLGATGKQSERAIRAAERAGRRKPPRTGGRRNGPGHRARSAADDAGEAWDDLREIGIIIASVKAVRWIVEKTIEYDNCECRSESEPEQSESSTSASSKGGVRSIHIRLEYNLSAELSEQRRTPWNLFPPEPIPPDIPRAKPVNPITPRSGQ